MKTCLQCKLPKDDENFQLRRGGKRRGTCRACRQLKRKMAGICSSCPKPVVGCVRCADCVEKDRAQKRNLKVAARASVLEHYGGRCVFCGIDESIFLTLDHMDGGGNEHRKREKEQNIYVLLKRMKKRDGVYPVGFQVLCWSCNSAKHIHGELAVREAVARLKQRVL